MTEFNKATEAFSNAIHGAMDKARDCDFKRLWPHVPKLGGRVSFVFPDIVQVSFGFMQSPIRFNINPDDTNGPIVHSSGILTGDDFVTCIETIRDRRRYIRQEDEEKWAQLLALVPPILPFKNRYLVPETFVQVSFPEEVDKFGKEAHALWNYEDPWIERFSKSWNEIGSEYQSGVFIPALNLRYFFHTQDVGLIHFFEEIKSKVRALKKNVSGDYTNSPIGSKEGFVKWFTELTKVVTGSEPNQEFLKDLL